MVISDDTIRRWQAVTAAGGHGYVTLTKATVRRMTGAGATAVVPVSALQWGWDGTSTTPLSGRVTVPAIDWSDPGNPIDWRPSQLTSPLSPFGNVMRVDVGVDNGIDPVAWITLGQGLILETSYARPAETLEVTLGDLGLHYLQAVTVTDWSVTAPTPVAELLRVAMDGAWLRSRPAIVDPTGVLAKTFSAVVTWPAGTPLWEIMQQVVQTVDPALRMWHDRDGSLLIDRRQVDTAVPPPAGSRPQYALTTGTGGHVLELASTLTRDGAVNIVAIAVEDTEVVDPTYTTITGTESDMAEQIRKDLEDVAGTGTGFSKKVTRPSGRRGGFTDKQPTPPRWPFMNTGAHPLGAVFHQAGGWSGGYHQGTDFQSPSADTVVAVCQGRIVAVYPNGGPEGWAGKYVVQQASDGSRFYYCHLESIACGAGDFLIRQDPIGVSGYTGNVRPPGPAGRHLHLERRDPPYRWETDCVDWRRGGDVK